MPFYSHRKQILADTKVTVSFKL